MASKSAIELGSLKRSERLSKQELEWRPTFPSNVIRAPDHCGPRLRQTTEPRRGIFPSPSSVSTPPTSFVSLHSTSNNSTKFRSASPAISANLPSTNYERDQEDQPESLANQVTQLPPQNSEDRTAPWVLASQLQMPKKPIDVEFITHLADIRRQADGNSSGSSSSSPRRSLALLGSCVSIASSAFSQSFSVASRSPPQAVEFPPEPVFTDAIPARLIQKLELLAVEQTPKARALKHSYPLQIVTATGSRDTPHKVPDSGSSTLSSPSSTTRQQSVQRPAPANSVLHNTPNLSHSTPPQQTKTPQTTPSSNSAQQPSGPTCASTATSPIGTKFIPLPLPSYHFPPPMISPEHSPRPHKANLKAWWNRFTLVKFPKGGTFKGAYRGPFSLSSPFHKPTNSVCSALDTADHPVFSKPLKESLRRASRQTLTVGFAWAATTFSALTASICPCIFSSPSNRGDGDDGRVVTSVTYELGVPSALVDNHDTAVDETAVLAVDTAELALGLLSTSTGGADADGCDGR